MLSQRSKILAQYLYILSVIFMCGSFFLAFATYDAVSPLIIGYKLYAVSYYIWLLIPAGIIFYLLLFVFGMYLNLNVKDFKSDVLRLLEITVIAVFLIYAILFMFKITYISRLFIGYFAAYSFLSLVLADYIGRKLVRSLKRWGYSIRNILLVSGDETENAAPISGKL